MGDRPTPPPRPERKNPAPSDRSIRLPGQGTPTGSRPPSSSRWARGSPRSPIPSAEAPVRLPSFSPATNPRASSDLSGKPGLSQARDPSKCLGRSVSAVHLHGRNSNMITQPLKVATIPLDANPKSTPRGRLQRDGPAAASTSAIEMKSGSQISTRSPRQGSFLKNPFAKRRSSSKTIDVDSFVPLSSDVGSSPGVCSGTFVGLARRETHCGWG